MTLLCSKLRISRQGSTMNFPNLPLPITATYKQESIERLTARYKALQRQLDVLYEDRLAEPITVEKWQDKQATINEEQKILNEQLARLKSEESKYFQIYSNILELALRAREIYINRSPEQRRQLLGYLFSNLTLKDQKVAHSYTQPVTALSKRYRRELTLKTNSNYYKHQDLSHLMGF